MAILSKGCKPGNFESRNSLKLSFTIVCTPPFCWEGFEPPTKFSKRRDLTGPQFLDRVCLERGVFLFRGGRGGGCCNFYIKNKVKSEIFNDKKSL